MTELQVSTSPRSTWLWAPNADTARAVQDLTGARDAVRNGAAVEGVIDVDIGVVALEACERLAAAGYTFTWHPNQHPLNRDDWLCSLPGMAAAEDVQN